MSVNLQIIQDYSGIDCLLSIECQVFILDHDVGSKGSEEEETREGR